MNAEALARRFEGCKLAAYQCPAGVWTIGWGHIRGVYSGLTCTQDEADRWLAKDLQEARYELLSCSPGPFAPGALDALTSFVFNLGIGNYRASTLRQFVDSQSWSVVKTELLKWDHCGGRVLPGLLARRQAESALISLA